jgi:hypothetical protein
VLRAAEDAPRFVWLAGSHGKLRRTHLPRPTFMLRYFVVHHVSSRTDALDRAYSRAAALSLDGEDVEQHRTMLDDFRRSIPSIISRRWVVLLYAVSALVFLRVASAYLLAAPTISDKKELKLLSNLEDSILSFDVHANALEALATTPRYIVGDLAFGLLVALYIVLRPSWSGFRIKRLLFNISTDSLSSLAPATMNDAAVRSCGLYELERAVFSESGAHVPAEFPFDLALSGLFVGLWIPVCVNILVNQEAFVQFGCIFLLVLSRAVWVIRTARRRLRPRGPETAEPATSALAPTG